MMQELLRLVNTISLVIGDKEAIKRAEDNFSLEEENSDGKSEC